MVLSVHCQEKHLENGQETFGRPREMYHALGGPVIADRLTDEKQAREHERPRLIDDTRNNGRSGRYGSVVVIERKLRRKKFFAGLEMTESSPKKNRRVGKGACGNSLLYRPTSVTFKKNEVQRFLSQKLFEFPLLARKITTKLQELGPEYADSYGNTDVDRGGIEKTRVGSTRWNLGDANARKASHLETRGPVVESQAHQHHHPSPGHS
ncbi:hypothetical protein WN55_02802 [Dufourea novaeangliae]|uniref:Uncharacterized protein n=1 Tax=Dufourea novaeangliae TaxID=178035 RepID=A0A154NXP8_DUFNO|nr:hypothetical protein WN55_02802 [Dufourea novaeangliae]